MFLSLLDRRVQGNTTEYSLQHLRLYTAAKLIAKMDHGHGLVDRMLIATPLAYRPTLSEMENATEQLSTEVVEDFAEYFQNVSETAEHIQFTLTEDAKFMYRETIDQFAVEVNTAIQQGKVPPKSKIPELVPRLATALHVFNHTMNELLSGVPATASPTEISKTTLESAIEFVRHLSPGKPKGHPVSGKSATSQVITFQLSTTTSSNRSALHNQNTDNFSSLNVGEVPVSHVNQSFSNLDTFPLQH